MFTGIVEEVGRVRSSERGTLVVEYAKLDDVALGDSIAVNGCDLTVSAMNGGAMTFNCMPETYRRTNLGELQWRISLPVSALILALLAIPMSFVNPRAGRSINLLFALLVFVVYVNLLTISQARVAQGKLAFSTGWWLVHAVMLALLLVMFARRLSLFRMSLRR